jgi:hypothetical protein
LDAELRGVQIDREQLEVQWLDAAARAGH